MLSMGSRWVGHEFATNNNNNVGSVEILLVKASVSRQKPNVFMEEGAPSSNDFGDLDSMVSGQMFSCFISPVPLAGTCDNTEAMSGILMRKFEEVSSSSIFSVWESDDEVSSGKSADDGDSVSLSTSNHFIRSKPSQDEFCKWSQILLELFLCNPETLLHSMYSTYKPHKSCAEEGLCLCNFRVDLIPGRCPCNYLALLVRAARKWLDFQPMDEPTDFHLESRFLVLRLGQTLLESVPLASTDFLLGKTWSYNAQPRGSLQMLLDNCCAICSLPWQKHLRDADGGIAGKEWVNENIEDLPVCLTTYRYFHLLPRDAALELSRVFMRETAVVGCPIIEKEHNLHFREQQNLMLEGEVVIVLNQYIDSVMHWMRASKLKLNPDKMEVLLVMGRLFGNLYAGQEATVRTGHRTTDWFKIEKGVQQGCILSPCLFNLYAEHIMKKAGLDESQGEIKIAMRNINNLRYADDATLMAESEEELKSLLLWMKEENAKVGLKRNIKKTKIMASGPITSWQIDGEEMEARYRNWFKTELPDY
ncbi:Cysteine/serine-rich nuclear protein 3 [Varanus komodoensis]|nr:Cysteine/serine-rich nuclear protein 3 [Varanus komodoensis]